MKKPQLKPWLKSLAFQLGYKEPNYGSCFGFHNEKYEELYKWLKRALKLQGGILEFGIATGGSTCLMAEYIKSHHSSKILDSFDSFTGFDPQEFDENFSQGYVTDLTVKNSWQTPEFRFSYVQRKLKAYKFSQFVSLHRGFFQDTLPQFLADSVETYSFALIDCDLASSIEFCANSIYPHMSPGGIILFDDYASLEPNKPDTAYSPGVKMAVDQFIAQHTPSAHGYDNGLYHFVKTETS